MEIIDQIDQTMKEQMVKMIRLTNLDGSSQLYSENYFRYIGWDAFKKCSIVSSTVHHYCVKETKKEIDALIKKAGWSVIRFGDAPNAIA